MTGIESTAQTTGDTSDQDRAPRGYRRLFEPIEFCGSVCQNRIVNATHGTNLPEERELRYLAERVRGGAGLIGLQGHLGVNTYVVGPSGARSTRHGTKRGRLRSLPREWRYSTTSPPSACVSERASSTTKAVSVLRRSFIKGTRRTASDYGHRSPLRRCRTRTTLSCLIL